MDQSIEHGGHCQTFISAIRKFSSFEIKSSMKPVSFSFLGPFLHPHASGDKGSQHRGKAKLKQKDSDDII